MFAPCQTNHPFIAVIDDDESMCQALSRLLRLAGYDVRTYFSAEAFLDDPEHVHARFAVTDIQLRGMSGFDLQRRLREILPCLPVAFITAHDEPATRAQARDSGCVAYFRKPFSTRGLLAAIHSALAPNGADLQVHSPPPRWATIQFPPGVRRRHHQNRTAGITIRNDRDPKTNNNRKPRILNYGLSLLMAFATLYGVTTDVEAADPASPATAGQGKKPNILVIMGDDCRYLEYQCLPSRYAGWQDSEH